MGSRARAMALLFPCNLLKINANQKPETNSVPNVSIGGTSAPVPHEFPTLSAGAKCVGLTATFWLIYACDSSQRPIW